MDQKIIFKRDSTIVKQPFQLKKNNVSLLYALRNIKGEPTEFQGSIQEYPSLYQKMHESFLRRNLDRTKSMKFGTESNVYGLRY